MRYAEGLVSWRELQIRVLSSMFHILKLKHQYYSQIGNELQIGHDGLSTEQILWYCST